MVANGHNKPDNSSEIVVTLQGYPTLLFSDTHLQGCSPQQNLGFIKNIYFEKKNISI